MVEHNLVAENKLLRLENADLREEIQTLQNSLRELAAMLAEGRQPAGVFYARQSWWGRLVERFGRIRPGG